MQSSLTVLVDNAGTVSNYSREAAIYARDTFSASIDADTFLLVGHYKTFESIYVNITEPGDPGMALVVSFWNGSDWVAAAGVRDETKGFSRSGFLKWDRLQTDQASSIISGQHAVFMRISAANPGTGSVTFAGVNLLLACDTDLRREFPNAADEQFLQGQASHVLIHEASRNDILQELRKRGYATATGGATVFDLLAIEEIKQAAVYLALSKIFLNASDSPEDIWMMKSKHYAGRHKDQMATFLAFDSNDDGEASSAETRASIRSYTMSR